MTTSRRGFLKGAGLAFIAATSPAHSLKAEESAAWGDAGFEPFVQVAGTRIAGTRDLAANGW